MEVKFQLKMYITQLRGVFEDISRDNEEVLEETGRRLAQCLVSGGQIYVHGWSGHSAVVLEATDSPNALPGAKPLFNEQNPPETLSERDTVLLFVPVGFEDEALNWNEQFRSTGADLISVSFQNNHPSFEEAWDVHLTLPPAHPLIPFSDTKKIGDPSSFAALFLYHLIYFSVMEILDEQDLLED
jgi:hypothetical protein